jgi:SAM-dependent methyltransferase
MSWRGSQATSRERYRDTYDADEAERYDALVGHLSREGEDAYLSDLNRVFSFASGMQILDVGAGTGALCQILSRLPGLSLTALEPAPAMLAKLKSKAGLSDIRAVEGFCDAIVSRQLVNGLFDPLAAFQNWYHWLVPGGAVVLIDGLYGRSAWTGAWQEEVDVLPL